MTDYQLKTILKMVMNILQHADNLEEARNEIDELIGEQELD